MAMSDYAAYMAAQHDEEPLYIFDRSCRPDALSCQSRSSSPSSSPPPSPPLIVSCSLALQRIPHSGATAVCRLLASCSL